METLGAISRNVWIVLGVVLLLIIVASYSQGKIAGINKCVGVK